MFKLLSFMLMAAFGWQLSSCRYIGQQNYHSPQHYPALPYSDYGYGYSGPSLYQPPPYQMAPYQSPSYSPPGTYLDHRRGILRPFPGGGVPVLVDYHKRCSNQYVGLKPHPDDRQYYYVCKPDSVVFGKCQNLQVFNATCGQCVQYPRPEYMPNCESVGRFPIYSDCRIYFKCEEDLVPQIYSCPPNMIFSPANHKCIAGNHCATTQISTRGSILPEYCEGKFPPCYENGVFRSPADCSLYYTCELQTNGVFLQTRLRCPEGNFYDKQKNQCLPKQHVPCDCIQVAELVYPKPNPLPFQPSVYPAHFEIDSLEENYYPIEKSEEDNDSTGDSAGDEDTFVKPEAMAVMAAIQSSTAAAPVATTPSTTVAETVPTTQSTTAVPETTTTDVPATETAVPPISAGDVVGVLDSSIDVNNQNMEDAMAITEQTTSTTEDGKENETTVSIEDQTTTLNSTTASPVNSTIAVTTTTVSESTTEQDVFTTKPVEETTIHMDLEGSGSDSEIPEEDTVTSVVTETVTTKEPITDKTTTVAKDSSSSVSPTTAEQTTTPAAPVNSTIAPVQPQSASRLQSDTQSENSNQTLNNTLSPPTPTQEVPETSTLPREEFTRDSRSTTANETLTTTQSSDMDSATQDLRDKDVNDDIQAVLGSEITQTPQTTTQTTTTITTEASITETPVVTTTESTTDVTFEEDDVGLLDSEILIDDLKSTSHKEDTTFDNTVMINEELLPITAKGTFATAVPEQETQQITTFETTTEMSDVLDTEITETSQATTTSTQEPPTTVSETPLTTVNPSDVTAETITEVTTTATEDSTTDVTLESDELGLLDSEIFMGDSKPALGKDKESFDKNLLVDEELLPVSAKSTIATTVQELQSSETTLMPENVVLGSEVTATAQAKTESPTTVTTEASTTVSTEDPTTTTTESFTDVPLEDDVFGLLDSEITMDHTKQSPAKDEENVGNLLAAEEMLPVNSAKSIKTVEEPQTSLFETEGTTMMPESEETTQTEQTVTTPDSPTTPIPTNPTTSVTEVPTTATTESFTDVPLEDDDVGLLDSEILIDDAKPATHNDETTFDNNLLLAEELLPVANKTSIGDEDKSTNQFLFDETTMVPELEETSGSFDVTDQTTSTPQTTPLATITSEQPTLTTMKTTEDNDELGVLDSELVPELEETPGSFDVTDQTTTSPPTTPLETISTEQSSSTTIKATEDIDDIGVLDSELVLNNKTIESTKESVETTEAINIPTDSVTPTEVPVTQAALMTTVTDGDDLITEEDELGVLDSEIQLPEVSNKQASSVSPSTPDTTEKTTQTSSTSDSLVENSTENPPPPPPTHSTTISTTQTPTVTPKYNASTSTIPTPHSLVIKVREDCKQSPHNSPNNSLYFTLHTKPVISNNNNNNNNNTNSYNQTVTEPPFDKANNGEIPRLEIIAERPIDIHFSICPPKCDADHKHNYSSSSNRAVQLKWFPNKSNQTMSFETSSNIKTEGDADS